MHCILCQTDLPAVPSWTYVFGKDEQLLCTSCQQGWEASRQWKETSLPLVDKVTTLYCYNSFMKDVIYLYKGLGHIAIARLFAQDVRQLQRTKRLVLPIPTHVDRQLEHGFCHTEQLLIEAHVPYLYALRKNQAVQMSQLNRSERLQQRGWLEVVGSVEHPFVTLVDDIVTTGSTLQLSADVLLSQGVTSVEAFVLCRTK